MRLSLSKNLFQPMILALFFLGFSSGLPLALTSSTLTAWYTQAGVSLIGIGLLTLIGQPYIYKFIWAPLMDKFIPPFLGRRRGWLIITQGLLIACIMLMACFSPSSHPKLLALLALLVAFVSASQDNTSCAVLVEVPSEEQKGLASAVYISGYRVAVIVSGAMALIMAQNIGWHLTYLIMGSMMLIGIITTLLIPEPKVAVSTTKPSIYEYVALPFIDLFKRYGAKASVMLIAVIILYKLGDAFALSLNTTFLLRDLNFSLTDVGVANKGVGMISSIAGGIIGGLLMTRLNLFRSLIIFGLFQAASNLAFMWLAYIGHHYAGMLFAIFAENFCGGLSNTGFLVLIMTLCNKQYSATQFALFSAFASLGRVYVGPIAAMMIDHWGWMWFYFGTFLISLPGIAMLPLIKRHLVRHS
ncbi:MAG: muropeptide transporter AmpG [Gammaproteobacteria bacterium]|jgi:PAT family beta-lactamase induction signal transducer AmpG|nr:muropeptide transporter AmpG [Gammaproteobacteria bacterium]